MIAAIESDTRHHLIRDRRHYLIVRNASASQHYGRIIEGVDAYAAFYKRT